LRGLYGTESQTLREVLYPGWMGFRLKRSRYESRSMNLWQFPRGSFRAMPLMWR